VTGELDQLLGVMGGLAVLLLSAGLALTTERARLQSRLLAFLGDRRPPMAIPRAGVPASATSFSGLRYQLMQSGLPLSLRKFLAIQLVTGLAGLGLARLVAQRFALEGIWLAAAFAAGALAGAWLPRLVLRHLRERRLSRFERQFPAAVDAIANALEAGLSLPQSLEMVAADMPKPLADDFREVCREMGLGLPLGEALGGLVERAPLSDIEIFVAAVNIQYRTGGNLSQILRGIAHTVRERLRIKGEIKMLTAQQRLSGYIVSALPLLIVLVLSVVSPSYFARLLEPGAMRMMLIMGGVSLAIGFYVVLRIAAVEV